MYLVTCYIVAILIAQLAVPIGGLILAIINAMITSSIVLQSSFAVLLTSTFGVLISAPISLAVGLPASLLLSKFNRLNFHSILFMSALVPLVIIFILGQSFTETINLVAIPTVLGAIMYWFCLKKFGALTSA